jgi:hypothetical protein
MIAIQTAGLQLCGLLNGFYAVLRLGNDVEVRFGFQSRRNHPFDNRMVVSDQNLNWATGRRQQIAA